MKNPLKLSLLILLTVCWLGNAQASNFSSLYVFGDSLSDGGSNPSSPNSIYKLLLGNCDPLHPCPPYNAGRYANGPITAEYLANAILAGGANTSNFFNFALAGATSGVGNFGDNGTQAGLGTHNLPGIAPQVAGYLSYLATTHTTADSNGLYMVWGGANDFLTGDLPADAADNIAYYVSQLASSGATTILVPNIPDLSRTPFVQGLGSSIINAALAFSLGFNQALANNLNQLTALFPATKIVQFDTFSFFNALAQNPAAYGFSNITDACINLPSICNDPAAHLFWDDFHPTTQVHALLASAMASQVPLPSSLALFISGVLVFIRRRNA